MRDLSEDVSVDYSQLYDDLWRPLLRLAQSLVDDVTSAEDIVQESFAALYAHEASLHDPAAASRYLHSCVINGARSALRHRRTVRAHLALARDAESAEPADARVLLTAEHDRVRAALARLPRRQREVLSLRFLADLDDIEIAEVIGTSHSNVRSAASRGLSTLRTALKGHS